MYSTVVLEMMHDVYVSGYHHTINWLLFEACTEIVAFNRGNQLISSICIA